MATSSDPFSDNQDYVSLSQDRPPNNSNSRPSTPGTERPQGEDASGDGPRTTSNPQQHHDSVNTKAGYLRDIPKTDNARSPGDWTIRPPPQMSSNADTRAEHAEASKRRSDISSRPVTPTFTTHATEPGLPDTGERKVPVLVARVPIKNLSSVDRKALKHEDITSLFLAEAGSFAKFVQPCLNFVKQSEPHLLGINVYLFVCVYTADGEEKWAVKHEVNEGNFAVVRAILEKGTLEYGLAVSPRIKPGVLSRLSMSFGRSAKKRRAESPGDAV